MNNFRIVRSITLFLILVVSLSQKVSSTEWQRINMGGGGAINIVGAGPTGTLVAGTDLAGAYIKRSSDAQWQMIGPLNGLPDTHVTGVAFDDSDKDIILLATEGGLYRSQDEGANFTKVDRPTPSSTNYYEGKYLTLAYQQTTQVPSGSRRVYASRVSQYNVADSRILRSDDGGQSFYFTTPLPSPNNSAVTKIIMHPQNPDLLVVLSNEERFITPLNALYMSNNGGNSWTEVAMGFNDITDVLFHPVAPHLVYVAHKPSLDNAKVHSISDLSNNNWQEVFTTPSYNNPSYHPILILWPNISATNKLRAININTTYHFETPAAWQIPANTSLGESRQWAGTEASWNLGWSKFFTILSPTLESVNHTIGFDLSNPDRILWATNQFVLSGELNGQNLDFTNLATQGSDATGWSSTGLDNITPFILDVNTKDPQVIYAGLNDLGCTVSTDAGATWKLCIHDSSPNVFDPNTWPDGFSAPFKSYGGAVSALVSDPDNASRVWMFAAGDQGQPVTPLRSDSSGASWIAMNWGAGQPSTSDIFGLSVDPTSSVDQRRLYVTVDGVVYRSQDHGNNWSPVYSCNSGCRITEVSSGGTVYAGGEEGLFVSMDHGISWSAVLSKNKIKGFRSGEVFVNGEWAGISGIAIDPINSNIVYAAAFAGDSYVNDVLVYDFSQGVYQCDVTGSVNENTDCALILTNKAYVRDVAVDPFNSQNLYATSSSAYTSGGYDANSAGVLRSTDGGTSWVTFNQGLTWPMAIPIQVHPQNSNIIFVGSPGGGNYKIELSAPPVAATLVNPSGEITDSMPSYVWNAVSNATWYYLWVNDSTGNKIKKWYTAQAVGCGGSSDTCSITPAISLANGAGQWWVQTWNADGTGPWSAAKHFNFTNSGLPPAVATLVSPLGEISDNTPSYVWNAVADSSWYYLWVNDSTGNKIKKWYTAQAVGCGGGSGTCSITPAISLANGVGQWWIQTWNTNGYGPWSVAKHFNFTDPGTPPAIAILVNPSGGISDNTPSYVWNAIADSSWYYLWVNDSTGNKIKKWYTANAAGCGDGAGTCSVTATTALANGVAQWWVQTWNSYGYSSWSSAMRFTVGSTPILIDPEGSISNTTPTYIWSAVSNATSYLLWVNNYTNSGDFNGIVNQSYSPSQASCNNGVCSISPAIELLEGNAEWWVTASLANDQNVQSDAGIFTITP